jgi:hypothetical protein
LCHSIPSPSCAFTIRVCVNKKTVHFKDLFYY